MSTSTKEEVEYEVRLMQGIAVRIRREIVYGYNRRDLAITNDIISLLRELSFSYVISVQTLKITSI